MTAKERAEAAMYWLEDGYTDMDVDRLRRKVTAVLRALLDRVEELETKLEDR